MSSAQGYESHSHTPVLLAEVIEGLQVRADGIYMDCTFGRGGHTRALLAKLGPRGRVVAIDRDPQAVAAGRALAAREPRVSVIQASFDRIAALAAEQGVTGKVSGVLFDLGVSSPQLDDAGRGFSFQVDGPLDMRMDPGSGESAAQWLARADAEAIARVLFEFGEERHARRIARAIVARRAEAPIESTRQLAEVVAAAQPAGGRRAGSRGVHPATRTFQAIRIHINRELEALDAALEQVPGILAAEGRLAVISFHSLEDRRVKRFMRARSRGPTAPRGMPVAPPGPPPVLRILGPAIRAGSDEVRANPRARSAVLRIAARLP
jgi:16S rRNA (cytosine1402-N4)-methyltransferase